MNLLEGGDTLTLVEIKAGQTFRADATRHLDKVAGHIGLRTRRALVYGGDLDMRRNEVEVIGWRSLARVI